MRLVVKVNIILLHYTQIILLHINIQQQTLTSKCKNKNHEKGTSELSKKQCFYSSSYIKVTHVQHAFKFSLGEIPSNLYSYLFCRH